MFNGGSTNRIKHLFTATYPLDLTKTRLQIQGEAMSNAARTALPTAELAAAAKVRKSPNLMLAAGF